MRHSPGQKNYIVLLKCKFFICTLEETGPLRNTKYFILVDIKMLEIDGYAATRLMREAGIKMPIIAQTAYADYRDKSLEAGCTGFISKPFDRNKLLATLAEYLR